jgi:hypothetical protein
MEIKQFQRKYARIETKRTYRSEEREKDKLRKKRRQLEYIQRK